MKNKILKIGLLFIGMAFSMALLTVALMVLCRTALASVAADTLRSIRGGGIILLILAEDQAAAVIAGKMETGKGFRLIFDVAAVIAGLTLAYFLMMHTPVRGLVA